MSTLEDPFNYPDRPPDWFTELKRSKQRAKRSEKLGRPIGSWGGSRKGAGRKKTKTDENPFNLVLNSLQRKSLLELGNGDLNKGIQVLIDQNL